MTEQEYQQYLKAQRNYSSARIEILLVIIMTIINMVVLPASGTYFVCSITLATLFIASAQLINQNPSEFDISAELAGPAAATLIVLAIIIVALYLLFFFLSKKRKGCLITLLVLFSIDTLLCLIDVVTDPTLIIDIVIHAITIYFLVKGISSAKILQEHFAKGVAVSAKEIRGYFEESQRQKADEAINRAKQPQFQDDDPFGYGTPTAPQTTVQQANIVTNCPACGAKRNGTDKFCPYCGTAYESAKTDIQSTEQSATATTEQPATTVTTEQPTTPPAFHNDDNSDDNEDL